MSNGAKVGKQLLQTHTILGPDEMQLLRLLGLDQLPLQGVVVGEQTVGRVVGVDIDEFVLHLQQPGLLRQL